jgi:hypothetical protein
MLARHVPVVGKNEIAFNPAPGHVASVERVDFAHLAAFGNQLDHGALTSGGTFVARR